METVIGIGLDQGDQHRDDAPEAILARQNFLLRATALGPQNVQRRRTFQSGSSSDVKESTAIRSGELPISFGNIQRIEVLARSS